MKEFSAHLFRWLVGYLFWVRFVRIKEHTIPDPLMRVVYRLFAYCGLSMLVSAGSAPLWVAIMLPGFSLVDWLFLSFVAVILLSSNYLIIGLALATIWPNKDQNFWLAKPFWLPT